MWTKQGFYRRVGIGLFVLGLGLAAITPTTPHAQGDAPEMPQATTIVVTTQADSGPGSLRQALLSAIAGDTIVFDQIVFPPASPAHIVVQTALPDLSHGNLTLDASNAGVVLNGGQAPSDTDGLRITSNNNVIKGLWIKYFRGDGIEIANNARQNQIGGRTNQGNNVHGEGNVITQNNDTGIRINGGDDNTLIGNLIGLDGTSVADVRFQAVVISPNYAADRIVFMGTRYTGVYRSTDGGAGWQTANTGLTVLDILSLAISPNYATDQTVFAGTAAGGIFKSSNGGNTWVRVDGNKTTRSIAALGISPNFAVDQQIYASAVIDGMLVSSDGGASWAWRRAGLSDFRVRSVVVSPNYATDQTVFALTWGQLYSSTNQGLSWNMMTTSVGTDLRQLVVSPDFANDQTLFVLRQGCQAPDMLWKSINAGRSWGPVGGTHGWCNGNVIALAPSYATSPTLLMGDDWGGIFRSIDGGVNWSQTTNSTFNYALAFSPDFANDATAFMGLGSGFIFSTTNSGASWTYARDALQGNSNNGIYLTNGARGNVVGSTSPDQRNVIANNNVSGIGIWGTGSVSNTVHGNYIGTDASGLQPLGNLAEGVYIGGGAQYNLIGGDHPSARNLISANGNTGVSIRGTNTHYNTVSANYIGLNANGQALGNRYNGIVVEDGAQFTQIGGIAADARNLISANGENGVGIWGASTLSTTVSGNYIGTDPSGLLALGNGSHGLAVGNSTRYNTIGREVAGGGNLISANADNGMNIAENAQFNTVKNNLFGTDVTGRAKLGNQNNGVALASGAQFNYVGGQAAFSRNLFAGHLDNAILILGAGTDSNTLIGNLIGVNIDSTGTLSNTIGVACLNGPRFTRVEANTIGGNRSDGVRLDDCERSTVSGNYIGTNVTGTLNLGNGENGIHLLQGASRNTIGVTNTIAYNGHNGIRVWDADSTGNNITGNSIYANAQLGIETGAGGNAERPPPVITRVTSNVVEGSIFPAGAIAILEIYSDGEDEGKVFEGAIVEAGQFMFTTSTAFKGPFLTVTARDTNDNTSAFSLPFALPSVGAGDAYEPDDTCPQAKVVGVGAGVQPHTFHRNNDDDWFRFDGVAGHRYVVQTHDAKANADIQLELYQNCAQAAFLGDQNALGNDAWQSFKVDSAGPIYVRVINQNATANGVNTGYHFSVRDTTLSPIVVIVEGYRDDLDLQAEIRFAAELAYNTFLRSGVPRDRIRFLARHRERDIDKDGMANDVYDLPTPHNVRDAIQTWSVTQGLGPGVPFYVYLVDHGGTDQFFAHGDNGKISASELDAWLTMMEDASKADQVNVIIEACKSGSFIDDSATNPQTVSKKNRVVIASTSAVLNAFPSVNGAYFSDAFWSAVAQNNDLRTAFRRAAQAVLATGLSQQPWLDDNGDKRMDMHDGLLASVRGLGSAFGTRAPVIDSLAVGVIQQGQAEIKVQARDDISVTQAWVEVFPPGFISPPVAPDGETPKIDVPGLTLTRQSHLLFAANFNGFTQTGTYRLVAYVRDDDQHEAVPIALQQIVTIEIPTASPTAIPTVRFKTYLPWLMR